MTQIERIDKKILCLNMRIERDTKEIETLIDAQMKIKNNRIIKNLPEVLFESMAYASGFTMEEIRSDSKKASLVFCRIILAKDLTDAGFSTPKAGKLLNRDHSSVIHLRDRYQHDSTQLGFKYIEQPYRKVLESKLSNLRTE